VVNFDVVGRNAGKCHGLMRLCRCDTDVVQATVVSVCFIAARLCSTCNKPGVENGDVEKDVQLGELCEKV
jgi:hypothetical protein